MISVLYPWSRISSIHSSAILSHSSHYDVLVPMVPLNLPLGQLFESDLIQLSPASGSGRSGCGEEKTPKQIKNRTQDRVSLSLSISIYIYIYLSTINQTNQSINQSHNEFVHLSLSIHLSIYPSICPFCLSIGLSIDLSIFHCRLRAQQKLTYGYNNNNDNDNINTICVFDDFSNDYWLIMIYLVKNHFRNTCNKNI